MMNVLNKLKALEEAAIAFGFNWETPNQIMAQIQSECGEIAVHLDDNDREKLQEEIGDLLHAVFSLCIFCQFDPTKTLEKSVTKFELRFDAVKKLAKAQGLTSLDGKSFDELMHFWDQAKKLTTST